MAERVKNPGRRRARKSAANAAPGMATPYLSAGERRAQGKALRDRVPRDAHAGWKTPKQRRDPVALLSESNAGGMAAFDAAYSACPFSPKRPAVEPMKMRLAP